MQMTIDLPESVFDSILIHAEEARTGVPEWIAEALLKVIRTNEIHHMRKDVIDWGEELLS